MTVDKREERMEMTRERRRTLVNLYQKWDIQVAAGGRRRGSGGELAARQASEQSRDKCDMRLLTIYQHVECGRSSQRDEPTRAVAR